MLGSHVVELGLSAASLIGEVGIEAAFAPS
jgi:hypothetical protein